MTRDVLEWLSGLEPAAHAGREARRRQAVPGRRVALASTFAATGTGPG